MRYFYKIMLILLVCKISLGQDIRFSQFYAAPLSLNPALTGLFNGDHRFVGNYRSQWKNANADFITTAFSYDSDLLGINPTNHLIGTGIMVFNDKAGFSSGINTFDIALTGSYHLPVGENATIAMGLQTNFVQKSTFGDFKFPNSWVDGLGYEQDANGDAITTGTINSLDVNTGAFFYMFPGGGESSIFLGLSSFHLVAHKESFIPSIGNSIGRRIVGHGGTRITTKKEINFVPNFLYMRQGRAEELNLGFSVEFEFPSIKSAVAVGFWTRARDAVIPNIAFDFNNIHLGLSYDFNLSELQTSSDKRGGFELSLQYILNMGINNEVKGEPCPRF